jgi:integrase
MSKSVSESAYSYPVSRLKMMRGKHTVVINVPAHLRHLYGGLRSIRRTTGTSDLKVAQAKHHHIAQQIYDEFDQKQRNHLNKHHNAADNFAADAIYGLATSFNYKNIPDLKPSTDYGQLVDLKTSCDVYADMVMNSATVDETEVMADLLATSPSSEEVIVRFRELQINSSYTTEQKGLAGRYKHQMTQTYWHDLLIEAAREQGLPEPRLDPLKGADVPVIVEADGNVMVDTPIMRRMTNQPVEPISRPARVIPTGALTIASVMDEYLVDMRLKQNLVGTQRKLTRWNEQFLDVMGDLEIAKIQPKHGYEYVRKVLADNPSRSNRTLKDYCWGVQNLLKYCVESGYIQTNPFGHLDLKKYGREAEETQTYSSEDITTIFNHNWNEQDRLLLSIVATTGMRPSEVGNMTWERFNDTEYDGIRYITTTDADGEKVRVKNRGSKRDVPLHPDLILPKKGVGRLFDYVKDEDGRCSTDIGHKLNHILERLVPHPQKSIRSFRRTFKVMLRDVGVGEEVHDAITGHNQTSSSGRKNYGGMGLKVKFEAISKLDISFVNKR